MKKNILFITRNGLLEPLGQSQILSYLVPLSKDFSINIISFEKNNDVENKEHLNSIRKICVDNNIEWKPLTYRKIFRSLGVLVGFIELFFLSFKICKTKKINCIHARSYYPAFVALVIHKLKKTAFIFDMRALWPEELVEAGRLKENSVSWKIIKNLEKKCLKNASAVVSLTHAAVNHLDNVHQELFLKDKMVVIPTCANLKRFKLKDSDLSSQSITISCIGSMLSGWFKINMLKEVVDYLLSTYENVCFEFLTRDDKEKLLQKIDLENKWQKRIHIESVLFKDMPMKLSNHNGSVFFFTSNISKLGSAPTRMAEILGTGLPVLTNSGVGDVDKIVIENKVGELLNSENEEDIKITCDNFMQLVIKKDIAKQCRLAAEELFSLDVGVKNYRSIYNKII